MKTESYKMTDSEKLELFQLLLNNRRARWSPDGHWEDAGNKTLDRELIIVSKEISVMTMFTVQILYRYGYSFSKDTAHDVASLICLLEELLDELQNKCGTFSKCRHCNDFSYYCECRCPLCNSPPDSCGCDLGEYK